MKNAKNFKMMICTTVLLASSLGFAQQLPTNLDVRQQLTTQKNPLLDAQNLIEAQKMKSFKLNLEEKKDLEKIFERIKQRGGNSGGGGDEYGIKFHQVFGEAVEFLKEKSPKLYQKIESAKLEDLLDNTQVLIVDDNLDVEANGFIQNSTAYNNPELGVILLNRERVKGMSSQRDLLGAIALHEVASLAGLEKTGLYPISGKYARMKGISEEALNKALAVNRLQQIKAEVPKATPFDVLNKYFEEANESVNMVDLHHGDASNNKYVDAPEKHDCRGTKIRRQSTGDKSEISSWSTPSILGEVYPVVVKTSLTKAAKPSNGPLFPGEPETKKFLNGVTLCDRTGCAQQYYTQFENSKLETSSNSIIQTFFPYLKNLNETYKYEIRKNNGLLVFKRQVVIKVGDSAAEEVLVGYCYPREK